VKEPAPDVIVAGKFVLEGQLASGGMGSVWVAKHLDLEIPVAIKFMGTEVATSEEGRTRFEREAKAAAALQSPHVVNVLDYGVDEGLAYIAMELLVGEDLEDRLFKLGRISLEETLHILRQAAKALRRAQDLGIVHRDLKPGNLYLAKVHDDNEEILKILDFGIAKETGPTLLAKGPNTGQIIGSPHYMSPEAVRGARDIDFRSDLWSLGVIVFQCVTGRLPFPSENIGDVMGMILADPLPLATDVAPDLPVEIDAFFERALCRDRSKRFQSAREMAEHFAEAIGAPTSGYPGRGLSTPAPPLVGSTPAPPASSRRGENGSEPPSSGHAVVVPKGSDEAVAAKPPVREAPLSEKKPVGAPGPAVAAPAHKPSPPRSRGGILIAVTGLFVLVGAGLFLARTSSPAATGEAATERGTDPVPPRAANGQGASASPTGAQGTSAASASTPVPPPVPQASTAPQASSDTPSPSASASASSKAVKPGGKTVKGAASGKTKTNPNWGF